MKTKTVLPILFFAFCLTSCDTISQIMDSWVGSDKAQLIYQWGPPTKIASDGAGGEIYIYEYHRDIGQIPGRVSTDYFGNITYTAPVQSTYTAVRMFYVNSRGQIYTWRYKGL